MLVEIFIFVLFIFQTVEISFKINWFDRGFCLIFFFWFDRLYQNDNNKRARIRKVYVFEKVKSSQW